MVRVLRRPASSLARRAPGKVAKRTARKHKVILESITREKKKLRSVISFEAKAPPGYTFIPAGNPQLTGACKELCRKDGRKVYAVTTTPHMHTHNLSQHVHRIGYHFPSAVVAMVCMNLGLHLTATGNVMPAYSIGAANQRRRADSEVSQITINTEARDVLRDLFPNIPDNDLNQIIKTAFQKGQRKVGTAVELPLARRAQLAVVAHIRHVYTDYDRLLKTTSFHEARSLVEEPTLAKVVEWRGDDENGKTVLEDVFREVIVISDDDDSDTEEGEVPQSTNRDRSVEVISSHPRAEELQTRPVNYAHPNLRGTQLDISDDEAPPGFRFVAEVPKKNRIDRRGFSRYHAWDRAINRYRNGTDQHRLSNGFTEQRGPLLTVRHCPQESIRLDPGHASHENTTLSHVSVGPHATSNATIFDHGRKQAFLHPMAEDRVSFQETMALHQKEPGFMDAHRRQTRPLPVPRGPSKIRSLVEFPLQRSDAAPLPHGSQVEQVFVDEQRERLDQRLDPSNTPIFVGSSREVQGRGRIPSRTSSRIPGPPYAGVQLNPQDHVLPSIENPPSPKGMRHPASGHLDQLTKRMTEGFNVRSVTPRQLAPQDSIHQGIPDDSQDPASKRKRVAVYEPAFEPAKHTDPRSAIAPAGLVNTQARQQYASLGYAPLGLSISPNEPPVRRSYMVPIESSYLADRHWEKVSGPSHYATGFHPIPETVVSQRRDANPEGHSSPQEHHSKHYPGFSSHQKPPELGRGLSGTGYTVPADQRCGEIITMHHPASGAGRVYESSRTYQENSRPLSYIPDPQDISGRNRLDYRIVGSHGASKRSFYAEDFVRPVDLNDDVRMANHSQRPYLQTSQSLESRFGATSSLPPHHAERARRDRPGSMLLGSHTGSSDPRARTGRLAHNPVFLNDEPSYYSQREANDTSSTVRQHDRRGEPQLQLLRPTQEVRLHVPQGGEHRPSAHIRRVGDSRPHHGFPEGRTIVIVD